MTAERRQRIRQLVDQIRRERLTLGLHPDPTRVLRCDHCGAPFIAPPNGKSRRYCSEAHRVNWIVRSRRFRRIAERAAA